MTEDQIRLEWAKCLRYGTIINSLGCYLLIAIMFYFGHTTTAWIIFWLDILGDFSIASMTKRILPKYIINK